MRLLRAIDNLMMKALDRLFGTTEPEPEEEPTIHEIMLGIMLARTVDKEVEA